MTDAKKAPADDRHIVSKGGLAAILNWTRDRLDRRMVADPDFPVEQRGDGGPGSVWKFDVAKVRAHLAKDTDETPSTTKGAPAPMTPRGRRELAQAQQLEDELRASRGETVEAEPLRNALAGALQIWATYDDSASDTIGARLQLDEGEVLIVREILDDRRRELVAALRDYLKDDDDTEEDDDGPL